MIGAVVVGFVFSAPLAVAFALWFRMIRQLRLNPEVYVWEWGAGELLEEDEFA